MNGLVQFQAKLYVKDFVNQFVNLNFALVKIFFNNIILFYYYIAFLESPCWIEQTYPKGIRTLFIQENSENIRWSPEDLSVSNCGKF